jgi:hypothetical protein
VVFVFSVFLLDTNWDRLEHIANYDLLIRKMLGVNIETFGGLEKEFSYQTIVNNVSLIDEELLQSINALVTAHGQNITSRIQRKTREDSSIHVTNVITSVLNAFLCVF